MDMSFWNKTGEALAPPSQRDLARRDLARLDFATLVAGLDRAHARAHDRDDPPRAWESGDRALSPEQNLVTAILGRAGWRQAARALGGCFVPGAC